MSEHLDGQGATIKVAWPEVQLEGDALLSPQIPERA
jgi:hypothetical protein